MKRRDLLALGAVALSHVALPHSALTRHALAQSKYPDRPIRLIVPFAPGGFYDATGRPWAESVKPHLGMVVVENMGGGGGSLGAAAVARAQPDGYTILLGGTPALVVNPIAATRLPYHPIKDFEPIAILGYNATLIGVHPAQPMRTLKELADFAKANPKKLSFGSSGTGSMNHLVGERFKSLTGTDIPHVPYRGAAPAMTDVISGHIPMLVQSASVQAFEMHSSGKVRMLAVTSATRLAAAPQIPTVAEAGFPELTSQNFIGLYAPKGTPNAIIEQIALATAKAMADKDLQRMFAAAGFTPDFDSTPGKAQRLLVDEIAYWTPVIRAIGLKLD
jgi:tripartite-type tricarboxylate transporter receptor subunit TctC